MFRKYSTQLRNAPTIRVFDLGLVDYRTAHHWQLTCLEQNYQYKQNLIKRKKHFKLHGFMPPDDDNQDSRPVLDNILLAEHSPCFSLPRSKNQTEELYFNPKTPPLGIYISVFISNTSLIIFKIRDEYN